MSQCLRYSVIFIYMLTPAPFLNTPQNPKSYSTNHRNMSAVFGSGKIIKSDEFLFQIHGFLRLHKNGRCERRVGTKTLPTGTDPTTGVHSNDVVISPETNLSARLYIPKTTTRKLPILIYFHGGGFVVESAASPTYHPTLTLITAESNVIVVSVNYRLAPEHPIPVGYNDSWEAIKWVGAHSKGNGPDPWLNNIGDFSRVFLSGDSAGANIAHNMGIRVGSDPVEGINLKGIILLHPYFGGSDPIGSELGKHKQLKLYTDQFWSLANCSGSGLDDPRFNPGKDPNLSGLGCLRVSLFVAEKDSFRDRGLYYKELMDKSGWPGRLEMMESKGMGRSMFKIHSFMNHEINTINWWYLFFFSLSVLLVVFISTTGFFRHR